MEKVECLVCKKDIKKLINKQAFESNDSEMKMFLESLMCPDCFQKGNALVICKCGNIYLMDKIQKIQIASDLAKDNDDIDFLQFFENTYFLILTKCEECDDKKEFFIESVINYMRIKRMGLFDEDIIFIKPNINKT